MNGEKTNKITANNNSEQALKSFNECDTEQQIATDSCQMLRES